MWDPQRLTTLWAFTACYRDSFTYFYFNGRTNQVLILSRVYGCVTNNNGFWIGWLINTSFTITLNHNLFTTTNSGCHVVTWSSRWLPRTRAILLLLLRLTPYTLLCSYSCQLRNSTLLYFLGMDPTENTSLLLSWNACLLARYLAMG
jgi:hypothetical protein